MNEIFLSVPAVFSKEMIRYYSNINEKYRGNKVRIKEVYGSLPINTARESKRLPKISISDIGDFSNKLDKIGIRFNYTLNSTTITPAMVESEIVDLIKALIKHKINTFTVSSTLLLSYLHKYFSSLNLVLSTITGANSYQKIFQAKNFGAKRIILDIRTNRDFSFLRNLNKYLSKNKELKFEILLNEFCGDCLMRNTHYNLQSMNSPEEQKDVFLKNYPYSLCTKMFMFKAEDILKGYWVIPDWLDVYRDMGIKWMKVTGRTIRNIEWHKFVIESYMNKKYSGNIMSLAPLVVGNLQNEGKISNLNIEARYLIASGYLEHFRRKKTKCSDECGIACNYCGKLARKHENN